MRTVSAGRYLIDRVEVRLRAHVGLAFGTDSSIDPAEFVRRASLTAHRAAEVGETRAVWSGDTGNLTADDLALLADLRLANERDELSLAYQPQLNAKTGKIEGVEALLRWNSPRLGSVSPGRFIVLAERTGLIEQLTWWVVAEALNAQAAGGPPASTALSRSTCRPTCSARRTWPSPSWASCARVTYRPVC